jgi:hypothetical protein
MMKDGNQLTLPEYLVEKGGIEARGSHVWGYINNGNHAKTLSPAQIKVKHVEYF